MQAGTTRSRSESRLGPCGRAGGRAREPGRARGPRAGFIALAVVVAGAVFVTTGVTAAQPAEKGWTYDLAHELMSPFCPGRTLASCPSSQASELIQWISVQEASGASRDEVVAMLIDRYGEDILATPPPRGIGLLVYVLPVGGFVIGGGILLLVLRRVVAGGVRQEPRSRAQDRTPPPAVPAPPAPPVRPGDHAAGGDDDLGRLVDAELARRA